ncbi:MAG: hypothetical protein U0163_10860 [Gemmatimonadaceae bacterium]
MLLALATATLPAQNVQTAAPSPGAAALSRALDLETAGKVREALAAYREAMSDPEQLIAGVLGIERSYSQLGRPDSLLPLLDTLLAKRPTQPTLRAIQLRTLVTVRRDDEARKAFDQWVAVSLVMRRRTASTRGCCWTNSGRWLPTRSCRKPRAG